MSLLFPSRNDIIENVIDEFRSQFDDRVIEWSDELIDWILSGTASFTVYMEDYTDAVIDVWNGHNAVDKFDVLVDELDSYGDFHTRIITHVDTGDDYDAYTFFTQHMILQPSQLAILLNQSSMDNLTTDMESLIPNYVDDIGTSTVEYSHVQEFW